MRVVFFAQHMPDPCGAFFHDVVLAQALQARGHQVFFVTVVTKFPRKGVYRGIPFAFYENAGAELGAADVWCSPHFPFMGAVRRLNERFEKPIVVTMHFGEERKFIENCTRAGKWAEFLWFVSEHIKQNVLSTTTLAPCFVDTHVVRPHFVENQIKMWEPPQRPTGDCITLINANILKGAPLFVEMAKRFPDRKFLGVRPYYKAIPLPDVPNIEWVDIQDDIRTIMSKTRILMVPSYYESWGRVAFEAMYNGIPVLYTQPFKEEQMGYKSGTTEGMRDWIQDNGIACDLKNPDDWQAAILKLDDPEVYNDYSDRAYKCTRDMDIFSEVDKTESLFMEYAMKHRAPSKSKSDTPTPQPSALVGPMRFMATGRAPAPGPQAQQVAPRYAPGPRIAGLVGLRGGHSGMRR